MDKLPMELINKILIMREPHPTAKLIKDAFNRHRPLRYGLLSLGLSGAKNMDKYINRSIFYYWRPTIINEAIKPLEEIYNKPMSELFYS